MLDKKGKTPTKAKYSQIKSWEFVVAILKLDEYNSKIITCFVLDFDLSIYF